ncbi:hypothetical protein [Burkholderia stagnalis]|uniref:hypothetical protein n=1 Tax=Burkholderia stagnalis TaxID=1503054 RepID=UPI00325C18FD
MIALGLSIGRRRGPGVSSGSTPDPHYTARFWRLFFPYPNPGTPADYLAVGRVWMYRAGVLLTYDDATAYSESSAYSGRGAENAFRNTVNVPTNPADSWTCRVAGMSNQWIEVEFSTARAVDSLLIRPVTFNNRTPETIIAQASDDGAAWVQVGQLVTKWGADPQAIAVDAPK